MEDYQIENGVLTKYKGNGGDVVIPDGVTSIGNIAFYECTNLQSITIPDSVTIIGNYAFAWCKNLQSITIPDSVTIIGDCSFSYCESLQNLTIPDSVTSIGWHAFYGCKNLQSIMLLDSVTGIGEDAFDGCNQIRKCVLIPGSADEKQCKMIASAFGTEKLAISCLLGNIETNPILYKLLKSKITAKAFRTKYIPILIEKKEAAAVASLLALIKKMPSEEIDGYIKKAKNNAEIRTLLLNYKNRLYPPEILDRIEEIQTEKDFGLREKTLADYRKAFGLNKDGDTIKSYKGKGPMVVIPGNIKGKPVKIAEKAFINSGCIVSVEIEDGVTNIGDYAFEGCKKLQSITIPDSVTSIGDQAFYECESLQSITLPNSVTSIGKWAFSDCKKLRSITIPDNVMSIGIAAFIGCTNLQSIVVSEENPVYWSENNCLIKRANNCLIWGCQNSIIPDSVTSIGGWAFYGCKKLQSITLPNSVTSIGDSAFSGCEDLQSITLPDSVTSIGVGAFYDCTNLTIHAPAGSYAETYAEENHIEFQAI